MISAFKLTLGRATLKATLHELLAGDPWEKNYATIRTARDVSDLTVKIRKIIDFIRANLGKPEAKLFELEINKCEFECLFELETKVEEKLRPPNIMFDEAAFINLSAQQIPRDIQMVCAWGPRFLFPNDDIDMLQFIPELEAVIENQIPELVQEEARKLSSIQISNYQKRKHLSTTTEWLNFLAQRAVSFFKYHNHLLVLASDKGKHAVIMPRAAYDHKIATLLLDTNTYRQSINNCQTNIDKNESFVSQLIELGVVDKSNRARLSDKSAVTAKLYGLPKIHKPNAPLRPITSACEAPGRNLATLLVHILSPFFEDDSLHVKNTTVFRDFLNTVRIEEDEILVSFDVVSMFTNISVDLAIEIIGKKRQAITRRTKIPFDLLEKMLRFVLSDCAQFTCNTLTYSQLRGIAMGSAISPLIAKIVMSDLIATQLPKLLYIPNFMRVYVDDTACCIKKKYIQHTLDILNAYHREIQFTIELETNGSINFLDITMTRCEDRIITNWYKKPYASDRLLNYLSNHKRSTIINVAKAHIITVLKLSDGEFFATNREGIINRLRLNNFPEIEIIRLLNENYTMMRRAPIREARPARYGAIPQADFLTGAINRTIKMLAPNLNIAGRPNRTNGRVWSQLKDKTEIEFKTNIIIEIICNCRETIIVDHTRYKERYSALRDRITQSFVFNTTNCVGNKHCFDEENIICVKGASTAQKTRKKCELRASAHNKKCLTRLQRPSPRWAKFAKLKRVKSSKSRK